MAKNLPEILDDMRLAILGRKKMHSWKESGKDAYQATVGGIKDFGGDTLSKTAQRFNEALPFIERAGYVVTEIEVGLGLSPKLVSHLRMRELISDGEQAALLAETNDRKLVNTILASLFRASAAREKLNFKKFRFSDIELELSILPTVVLKFRPSSGDEDALASPEVDMSLLEVEAEET
jgi:hypothetical protein